MDKKLQKQLLEAQMRANQQAILQGSKQIVPQVSGVSSPVQAATQQQNSSEFSLIKKDTWLSVGLIFVIVLVFIALHYADKKYGFLLGIGNKIFTLLQ